jgi:23S rRNA G2069 N7-methylase RlmK/C1962 C5-methylase RlmI
MKLVPIFVGEDLEKQGGFLAVQFKDEDTNEFERLFDLWHDTEYLENFFNEHIYNLHHYEHGKSASEIIREAVYEIMDEADELEDLIQEHVHAGFANAGDNLQYIFKPLDNRVYELKSLQKSKASAKTRWRPEPKLRIYAIRLAPNLYIMTGGAIKLTATMSESPHLVEELSKIEAVRQWLVENGIWEPEDINEQL